MAWRVEWTGGTAKGVPPIGWRRLVEFAVTRSYALELTQADAGIELRVVLLTTVDGVDVDIDAVSPSAATLITWTGDTALPGPSRHTIAARRTAGEPMRLAAVERVRDVLDHVVEAGTLSRIGAARVVAALEAEMIRSPSSRLA